MRKSFCVIGCLIDIWDQTLILLELFVVVIFYKEKNNFYWQISKCLPPFFTDVVVVLCILPNIENADSETWCSWRAWLFNGRKWQKDDHWWQKLHPESWLDRRRTSLIITTSWTPTSWGNDTSLPPPSSPNSFIKWEKFTLHLHPPIPSFQNYFERNQPEKGSCAFHLGFE